MGKALSDKLLDFLGEIKRTGKSFMKSEPTSSNELIIQVFLKDYEMCWDAVKTAFDRCERWFRFYLLMISGVVGIIGFLLSEKLVMSALLGVLGLFLFSVGLSILYIQTRHRRAMTHRRKVMARIRKGLTELLKTKTFDASSVLIEGYQRRIKYYDFSSMLFVVCRTIALINSGIFGGSLYLIGVGNIVISGIMAGIVFALQVLLVRWILQRMDLKNSITS